EEYSTAPRRDRPRSIIQTQHIQERRTTRPRMATLPAPPPRDTAETPSRTIPVRHRPARNHQPENPSNRRHRNGEDCPHSTLRNRHHPDSQDTQAESPVYSHQLPRIPRQPLHDPQTGPTELHTPIPQRGFSSEELLHILLDQLESKNLHIILTLDEADVLIKAEGSTS